MNSEEVVRRVLDLLNAQGTEYMIVGSQAGNFYGVPRSTQDADIVVGSSIVKTAHELCRSEPSLQFDPQIAFESVTATKKIVLVSENQDFEIELFELSADEHDQQRFGRRIGVTLLGGEAWIASAEDMVVTKLRWAEHAGRAQDVADLINLIGVQGDNLDWPYIEGWCEKHETRPLLGRCSTDCAANLGGDGVPRCAPKRWQRPIWWAAARGLAEIGFSRWHDVTGYRRGSYWIAPAHPTNS